MENRYYKDTHKILGQTFNMLILQDFEAITPNLLARTIETVEGGGIVVCLLQGMKSLRDLYGMTMVSSIFDSQSLFFPAQHIDGQNFDIVGRSLSIPIIRCGRCSARRSFQRTFPPLPRFKSILSRR